MTTTMPPTTHALSRAERLRLMRSTRKLGALLGETPLFTDPRPTSPAFTPSHARAASMASTSAKADWERRYPSSQRSSSLAAASVSQATPPRSVAARRSVATPSAPRPVLMLHLPASFTPGDDPRTPRSPLPSPLSATFHPAHSGADRRRKMAKLARTLGENVPPELVFPSGSAAGDGSLSAPRPRKHRRASTVSLPRPGAEDEPFSLPSTVPYASSGASITSSISSSESDEHLLAPPKPHSHMHRCERAEGWSGEWGGAVGNMEDVVRGLRQLR
ncbi:hypothetical protein B0H15DRAFT_796592 [Mycena belliarum]|uniref:Uncharacterized protein n=1 Tax=Mycena belliarum TaxID=1033014 RepID=A0AAD6XUR7_9AGAR|nr:hypothetical protein B0H15DRAFT_796592 [Mycena belliae]